MWWAEDTLSDYHGNVGWTIYYKWFTEIFIPSLNKIGIKAVIILDNASYHSKKDLENWKWPEGRDINTATKAHYISFLMAHGFEVHSISLSFFSLTIP